MTKISNFKLQISNNKGFTLIESLIFMAIFSILVVVLFQLLISIFDVQLESQATSSISQDGRYILNKFTNNVKNAKTVTSPSIGSGGQSLVVSDGTTTYTYSLTNGNLMFANSTLGTSDQLNSVNTTVTSLNFLRLSDTSLQNNTITFSFTLRSKTIRRGGANSESFKTTVGTR